MKKRRVIIASACLFLLLQQAPIMAQTIDATSSFSTGYQQFLQGDYSDAIKNFEKSLQYDESYKNALFYLGKSYYLTGQYGKAKDSLNKLIGQEGDHSDSQMILDQISILNKRVTLDLQNVDVGEILRTFGEKMGMSVVTDTGVAGKISVKFIDIPISQAFKSILETNGFAYTRDGSIIKVTSGQNISGGNIIESNRLKISRTFILNYLLADDLSLTLRDLVTLDTKILTTKGSNVIVVEGLPAIVDKVSKVIAKVDIPPKAVMVQATMIDINFSNSANLGINLSYTNPANANDQIQTLGFANPPTATGATGLYYSVTRGQASALLEVLKQSKDYNLIASPKVIALNNKEAEIIMGQKLGYKVKTVTSTGVVESVDFLDVGTKLVFTPNIKDDNNIIMKIHPEISDGVIIDGLPQKNSTETTTNIVCKDGDTIIIGGLVRTNEQKVNKGIPFLQDIPVLGIPFRRVETQNQKRELIIFITPTIVRKELIDTFPAELERAKNEGKKIKPTLIF